MLAFYFVFSLTNGNGSLGSGDWFTGELRGERVKDSFTWGISAVWIILMHVLKMAVKSSSGSY